MPTRFYLPASGTSPLNSLAVDATWEGSSTTFFRALTAAEVAVNYAAGVLAASTDVVVPTVTTVAISAIDADSATSGGSITDSGDSALSAYGVCWNTTGSPTLLDCDGFTDDI